MDEFAAATGRSYHLFDYIGDPDAERVIIMMGSGSGAAAEAVAALQAEGKKVGLIRVRLFRPFDCEALLKAIPSTVKHIAVLDRTKEPGATGEPLYLDIAAAISQVHDFNPTIIGGRYGLSSKEFTPSMASAVFKEMRQPNAINGFTVGISDDVTHKSLTVNKERFDEPDDVHRAVFYGLGSDGTVGANKNSVKIVGENTPLHSQGYFVYDSKKAGAVTVSHLRFSRHAIDATYLIQKAGFVACHQFQFIQSRDILSVAAPRCEVPAEQSVLRRRDLGPSSGGGAAADHRQTAEVLRDRRL